MVQVGVGTLLSVGVAVLLGVLTVLYKVSANVATVSQNVSRMNDNLGTKLDSLNRNISDMGGNLRRISETTTRVETKFDGSSPNANHSAESNSDRDVETDGATEVVRPEPDSTPEGRFTLSNLGRIVHMDTEFGIDSDGDENCTVEITFPRELVVRSEKLNPDLHALSRGLVGSPKAISTLYRTITVILPMSDPGVVADWMDATARLLDNEEYYESIEGVNEEEIAEDVRDVLSDSDELERSLDDFIDSASGLDDEDEPDDDFTL